MMLVSSEHGPASLGKHVPLTPPFRSNNQRRATAMNIESVLITVQSLLDNKPYLHEPHQRDNPAFNDYVLYTTWQSLLLDYLQYERDPKLLKFMKTYVSEHGEEMLGDLEAQHRKHSGARMFHSAYSRQSVPVDYPALVGKLQPIVKAAQGPRLSPGNRTVSGTVSNAVVSMDIPSSHISAISEVSKSKGMKATGPGSLNKTPATAIAAASTPQKRKVMDEGAAENQPIELDAAPLKKRKDIVVDLTIS